MGYTRPRQDENKTKDTSVSVKILDTTNAQRFFNAMH